MKTNTTLDSPTANMQRLQRSEKVDAVLAKLRKRGCSERDVRFLLHCMAAIPREWRSSNETWAQKTRRRAQLAKKLRHLADEIENDPDLGEVSFDIRGISLNSEPEEGMMSFAQLLRDEASGLEPRGKIRIQGNDGSLITGREFEKSSAPARKISLRSYALQEVFELLQVCKAGRAVTDRAPNLETETLASVLLGEVIPPGTLTQLRKEKRRRYVREKQ